MTFECDVSHELFPFAEVDDVVVSFNLHHSACHALKAVIPSVSAQFGVRIDVPKAEVPGGVRVVIMEGDANAVAGAFDLMTNTISTKVGNSRITQTLHVPADKVGMVVGKQGSMVKRLQNATGGYVNMSSWQHKNRNSKGAKGKPVTVKDKQPGKKGARSRGGSTADTHDTGFDTASDGGDLSSVDEHGPTEKKSVLQVPTPDKKGAASDDTPSQQGVVLSGPADSVHMLVALITDLIGPDGHMSEERAQKELFKAGRPFLTTRAYFDQGRYKDAQFVWLQRSGAQAEEREQWHPEVEAAAREELGLPSAEEDEQAPDVTQEWDVVWLRQQQGSGASSDVHIQRGTPHRAAQADPAPVAPPVVPDAKVRAGKSFADILAEQSAARSATAAAAASSGGGASADTTKHTEGAAPHAGRASGGARGKHGKGGSRKDEGGRRGDKGKGKGGEHAHGADKRTGKAAKPGQKAEAAVISGTAAPKSRGGKQSTAPGSAAVGGTTAPEAKAAHKGRNQTRGKAADTASVSSGSSRGGRGRGRGGGGRGRGRGRGGGRGGGGAGGVGNGTPASDSGSKGGNGGRGGGRGRGRGGGRGRGRGGGGRGRGGGRGGATPGNTA